MSAASIEYLAKALFKLVGVDPTSLNPIVLIPKILEAQGIDPEQAQDAFNRVRELILDIEQNHAQINLRLIAIMDHLKINDPVRKDELQIETLKENENGH